LKRLAVSVGVAVLFAASIVSPALADPPNQHTHNLSVPGVAEPVLAPGFCQEASHTGFHNFHSLVHLGVEFGGDVEILGTNGCS
jgi:hypothetical protein